MTTARDIIDIAARAMYTQDTQDSMSGRHWDDLDDDERHDWRRLTHARMSYYGYTTEQIAAAEQPRRHR